MSGWLDNWTIKRVRKMGKPSLMPPITSQDRAKRYAQEHGGLHNYQTRPNGDLNLTYDGYPVPKGADPDW